jgi:methionyl-tRNA synthetase
VPVPGDAEHIMYVWLDALTNYITAVGYPDTESAAYRAYWPADVHMVGKDILRFHAVYWPAFLMGAGIEPPKRVFAHGWWTKEGQKISKSLGNVIDPNELVAKYGLDQVRYFLLREVPFGNDGDFSHRAMIGRMTNDLANDFGNLAQRSLSMIAKNCDGQLPDPGAPTVADRALLDLAEGLLDRLRGAYRVQAFNKALEATWEVIGAANRYIDEQAPWTLRKTDPARMATVLYVAAEVIRNIAILIRPFISTSSDKLLDMLKISDSARDFDCLGERHRIKPGTKIEQPKGLFPRINLEKDS